MKLSEFIKTLQYSLESYGDSKINFWYAGLETEFDCITDLLDGNIDIDFKKPESEVDGE